jgi:hypothetical protein
MFGFNSIGMSFGDILEGYSTNGVFVLAEFCLEASTPLAQM